MELKMKKKRLFMLYENFEKFASPYFARVVCHEGCAECCINVGNIDTTTLEGIIILECIKSFSPSRQRKIKVRLQDNSRKKMGSSLLRCPFLMKNNSCAIYFARPFSCRRLYSLEVCSEKGPVIPKQLWNIGRKVEADIQRLDNTGYTGHISFILELLCDSDFRRTYLNGVFDPDGIKRFAFARKLIINRFARHES
jgi:Fe-S-cluster containining protein